MLTPHSKDSDWVQPSWDLDTCILKLPRVTLTVTMERHASGYAESYSFAPRQGCIRFLLPTCLASLHMDTCPYSACSAPAEWTGQAWQGSFSKAP